MLAPPVIRILLYLVIISMVLIMMVNMVSDLGVLFDAKMILPDHVENNVQRGYCNLGFVIRTCIPFKCP